jgi:lipoprotein-releasing system permease protein
MFSTFFTFFIGYIVNAKTRQKLLLVAMAGLLLSSFSLLVVQSTLKGLQNNRIGRSKDIMGHFVVKTESDSVAKVKSYLNEHNIKFSSELQIEGLLRNEGHISSAIIHGVSQDEFLPEVYKDYIVPGEIIFSDFVASKLNLHMGEGLILIDPNSNDNFFGELPRHKTFLYSNVFNANEPMIDEFHAWTTLKNLQSLIRKRKINKIRIFQKLNDQQREFLMPLGLKSWEELNSTLYYALMLENNVILFLFLATIALVVLTISSGLSIFYARVKQDFASFWILGMSIDKIKKLGAINVGLITILALVIGNLLALALLWALKTYSPVIMPAMFVDRSLPVLITGSSFIFSFLVPALITIVFTAWTNHRVFSGKYDFLELIRSVGR